MPKVLACGGCRKAGCPTLAQQRALWRAWRGSSGPRGAGLAGACAPGAAACPLVLEPAELPLDRAALVVERLPAVGGPGDQGVQPVSLDPHRCRGTLAGRAAPLGRAPLDIGTRERPFAVLAGRLL